MRPGYIPLDSSGFADSIRRGGDRQAEMEMLRGQSTQRMVGDIANAATGFVQARAQQQEKKQEKETLNKRTEAFATFLTDWTSKGSDPGALLVGATRILGPKDGPAAAKAAVDSMGEAPDLDTQLAGISWMTGDPAAMRANWDAIRQTLGRTKERVQLPATYDEAPDALPSIIKARKKPVGTREVKVRNADGSETIRIVPDEAGFEATSAPPKPKRHMVTVPGPNGQPIQRLATEEELAQGVQAYRAPQAPPGLGPTEWAVDPETGQERLMTPAEIRKAGAGRPDTAAMREKQEATKRLGGTLSTVKALSQRVITEKSGIIQKAKAAGRSIEAELGDDPDYLAYQAARFATAGNLAVAQQGSRPSDADILRGWLPLVPDVFKDTSNSADLKWKLIEEMVGVGAPAEPAGGGAGSVPAPMNKAQYDGLPSGTRYKHPDGSIKVKP